MKGMIKFYNPCVGWGFITDRDTEKEYFLHKSRLLDSDVKKGDVVVFDLTKGARGNDIADHVKKI